MPEAPLVRYPMNRNRFVRFGALVPAALAVLTLSGPALAKDDAKEKPKADADKALRVAILPVVNRSAESLALDTINAVLAERVKELPPAKGSFILPDDVMRLLDGRGETDRARRITERWA